MFHLCFRVYLLRLKILKAEQWTLKGQNTPFKDFWFLGTQDYYMEGISMKERNLWRLNKMFVLHCSIFGTLILCKI